MHKRSSLAFKKLHYWGLSNTPAMSTSAGFWTVSTLKYRVNKKWCIKAKSWFHYRVSLSNKFVLKYIIRDLDYLQGRWNTRNSCWCMNGNVKNNQQKIYNRNEGDFLKAENRYSLHAVVVQYWRKQILNIAKSNKIF